MLTAILHRKRKAAKDLADAARTVDEHRQVYGVRLLVRGLLWLSVYLIAHGLLELIGPNHWTRVVIALLPMAFFAWYLWTWTDGVRRMDELQRRIELEALGFAFPATLVFLMTIGLLDLAVDFSSEVFSLHRLWLMMPLLYYIGLWRAKRRYE
jgi:hypothetical protein